MAGPRRNGTGGPSRPLVAAAIVIVVLGVAGISLSSAERHREHAADLRPDAPNVLLIISDDQRDGTLDVMPQTRQAFVAGGRKFPRAAVTTPLCCPSRVSILSGLYAHNHRIAMNAQAPEVDESRMMTGELRDAGYHTGLYGKYLNNWPEDRAPAGFDEHVVGYGSAGGFTGKEGGRGRADDWLGRRARQFIEAREEDDERPWFLVLSARSPHNPLRVARRYRDAKVPGGGFKRSFNERDLSDKPQAVRRLAHQTRQRFARRGGFRKVISSIRERQLKLLLSLDDMIGTTMRTLKQAGEDSQTLAIYVSDNGFFWGEHGFVQKTRVYPEVLEVPLMVRWPGRVEPGSRDGRVAANIDIAPTVYEAAGVRPGYELDGRSLLGTEGREWILTEKQLSRGRVRGIFAPGREQYLENRTHRGRLKSREYYDLKRDSAQLDNLVGSRREPERRIQELRRQLERVAGCAGESCP